MMHALGVAKRVGARIFSSIDLRSLRRPIGSPQPENYWGNVNPIGLRSCYDEGKRIAETLCFDYKRAHGVIFEWREFNTYGPKMHPNDVGW